MKVLRSSLVCSSLLVPLALGACQASPDTETPPPDAPSTVTAPIVNGQAETGYKGVGALVTREGNRYYGNFCTGTLIHPQWVLTAGHCVKGEDLQQQGIVPATTFFFMGNDARPKAGGALPEGEFHAVDAFVPFPQYDPNRGMNDIALVHLAEPVADADIYIFNTENLERWVADNTPGKIFTVGYGATEGVRSTGSGIKRSTRVNLDDVVDGVYVSDFVDTGTCFGDSGGPGFLQMGDEQRIIGVTSAGGPCPASNPNCDPCTTVTYNTRVDEYASWILDRINGPKPTCQNTENMCLCDEACSADGTCDPDVVCKIASCQETYFCIRQCAGDIRCETLCRDAATEGANEQAETLLACSDENCAGLSGHDRFACLQEKCSIQLATCFGYGATGTGNDTCDQVYDCFAGCTVNSCATACLSDGTADAQAQVADLESCLGSRCAEEENALAYSACARISCAEAHDACFPPTAGTFDCAFVDDCRMGCNAADTACPDDCYALGTAEVQPVYDQLLLCLGRNCFGLAGDAEAACRAEHCAAENLACRPPAGAGEPCDGLDTCGEGLECAPDASGAMVCQVPCVDGDEDGACVPTDCDDAAATTNPDAAEVCDNGADDDCDGAVDRADTDCASAKPIAGNASGGGCEGGGASVLGLVGLALVFARRRR